MHRSRSKKPTQPSSQPFLEKVIVTLPAGNSAAGYPFSLPLIHNIKTVSFPTQGTFLVGENGTGKSTLREAISVEQPHEQRWFFCSR